MGTRCVVQALLLAVPLLAVGVQTASAEDEAKPSGTVEIESISIGIGLGIEWGHGILTTDGMQYKFKLHGLKAIDVGGSTVHATGQVYHLQKPEQLSGTYKAYEADIAIIQGVGGVKMKNEHGVVMSLATKEMGLEFAEAGGAVKIQLADTPPVAAPPPAKEKETP